MTYTEALTHFGGRQVDLARVLRVNQSTVSQWKGHVPPHYQFQLQVLSGGALKVDPELIPEELRPAPQQQEPAQP